MFSLLFESARVADYIHDNCEGGRNERFHFHCHVMLAPASYDSLKSTCDDMGGQLTWFDTRREYTQVMNRVRHYRRTDFNDHLYTGNRVRRLR